MEKQNNNELINRIKEVLKDHEEPYTLGAWEQFERNRKKGRLAAGWKFAIGAAASFAALAIAFFLINDYGSESVITPVHTEIQRKPYFSVPEKVKKNHPAENHFSTPHDQTVRQLPEPEFTTGNAFSNDAALAVNRATSLSGDKEAASGYALAKAESRSTELSGVMKPDSHIETAYYRSILSSKPKDETFSAFRIGVAVAPMVSGGEAGTDLGLSGGVATEWELSEKFSLASGLLFAQNQLLYEPGAGELSAASNLNSVQANLVAIELPLNLQYHVNEHVFVSAGISSATFLKESYDYTYEFETMVFVEEDFRESGTQTVAKPITTYETVAREEPALTTFNVAAFYNLSLGYQYGLNEHILLSVEPFIKLPATGLTHNDLRYSAGGIQLKVKF